jgi:hypothetical protein
MWGDRSNKIMYGEEMYPQISLPSHNSKQVGHKPRVKLSLWCDGSQIKAWMYNHTHYIKDGAG